VQQLVDRAEGEKEVNYDLEEGVGEDEDDVGEGGSLGSKRASRLLFRLGQLLSGEGRYASDGHGGEVGRRWESDRGER